MVAGRSWLFAYLFWPVVPAEADWNAAAFQKVSYTLLLTLDVTGRLKIDLADLSPSVDSG